MNNDLATQLFNNFFLVAIALGLHYLMRWRAAGVGDDLKLFVDAWVMILVALFFRLGWWALALKLSGETETYHAFFLEWKWAMTFPTSALFAAGMIGFINAVEGFSLKKRVLLFALSFILAFGLTVI